ncbi:MAG TPA: S-adenosylmethionine decarboxylase [Chitinophagales bacterium]|nr:S-adenosylmethionine decarboxylase [Chitinophagales bacterium]
MYPNIASTYEAGLHILLQLQTSSNACLTDCKAWRVFSAKLLQHHQLLLVGCTYHIFDSGGFTAAICLKESHITIHTWPEFELLTLDIYLCNYQKNNAPKCQLLAQANIDYFKATVLQKHEIYR